VWWLKPVTLATQEMEISRMAVQGHSGKNVCTIPFSNNGWLQWCALVIPATQRNTKRIEVQDGLDIDTLISKNNQCWAAGAALSTTKKILK
jgi:hypothetical protein